MKAKFGKSRFYHCHFTQFSILPPLTSSSCYSWKKWKKWFLNIFVTHSFGCVIILFGFLPFYNGHFVRFCFSFCAVFSMKSIIIEMLCIAYQISSAQFGSTHSFFFFKFSVLYIEYSLGWMWKSLCRPSQLCYSNDQKVFEMRFDTLAKWNCLVFTDGIMMIIIHFSGRCAGRYVTDSVQLRLFSCFFMPLPLLLLLLLFSLCAKNKAA